MGSPWHSSPQAQPPQGYWQPDPSGQPPPQVPPGKGSPTTRRWGVVVAVAALNVASVAAAAAIAYAVASNTASGSNTSPVPAAPTDIQADSAATKSKVCAAFDQNTSGTQGQGGLVNDGQLNMPAVLRAVNGAVAVQAVLTPAAGPDLYAAAGKYISATMDMTSAALAGKPIEDINRSKDVANTAIFALADVCGLPH